MLDNRLKTQLAGYLQKLDQPITLSLSNDASRKGDELAHLVNEIVSLSDKISMEETHHERQPSLGIAPAGETPRIHFAGVPLGHEFNSLVLALLQSSGYPSRVDETLQDQIRALEGEYHFETYISLSCQNCPDVVQALNLMATLNPNIQHTMIDGALFQAEVEAKNILGVPAVYLNGKPFSSGRTTLEEMLAKLDSNAASRRAASLNEKAPYDLLIVGGGPAGAAAAIYAARKGIRTGLVADRFGGQVAETLGIENFISTTYTEGPKLVASLEEHVKHYDVDLITHQRARALHQGEPHQIELESGAILHARSLIIATGARWRELNVPGEHAYRGKGVAYCPHCDGPLFKGKRVAVIGGGNSGIEAAIDLAGIVEHVTVLEFADTLRADEVLLRKANSLNNIEIIAHAQTTEVQGNGERVTGLNYTDRSTGESHLIELEGVFVQIGLMPNTEWLRESGLSLTHHGEIEIDSRGATSLSGIFAAGDATNVPFKQIIIAMGAGATAALGAFDHLIRSSAPQENATKVA